MTSYDQANTFPEPLQSWLVAGAKQEASDLHLVVGYPAVLRAYGKLVHLPGDVLTQESLEKAILPIASKEKIERLQQEKNLDYALEVVIEGAKYRLRINLFLSGRSLGACIRFIPDRIPDFSWTSFPVDLAKRIAALRNGLVLFTGVTGSGKSTSLALIIDMLNRAGGYRILTIEDPIEYRFPVYANSVVSQREVGIDVDSFADGLKYGLRQDPDVILVGEIRDIETAKMALSAAETGHLVLSTLHTRDAKGAISRYADMFPQQVQNEIRAQLASGLRSVICQRLLDSSIEGEKQELALEVLFQNSAIGAAIRTGKLESVDNYILTGRSDGMISMDESIKRLVNSGAITVETAEMHLNDKAYLNR